METVIRESWHKQVSPTVVFMSEKLNRFRRINEYLITTNKELPVGGTLIGFAETMSSLKQRIFRKFFFPLNVFTYVLYCCTHRVFPKLHKTTANIYFRLSGGKNRVLSKAEVLGRLCSCGFRIEQCGVEDGMLHFVAVKSGLPVYNNKPSYWPFIRMKRIGKSGNMIGVYKLRTMHPYSEYLQEYILQNNGLDKGGKFKSDFRVTGWGRVLRKYWIDELPMLINLFKGELKLVGVRPLSLHYFDLYSTELKQLRLHTKPGLIPPFYADMPKTLEEIMDSEKKYLEAYYKSPKLTDIRYLLKSLHNIVVKKARSK